MYTTQQLPTLLRGPAMLEMVTSKCTLQSISPISNSAQQLLTTRNNMQQCMQTDTTCNIQQCWELLANNVAPVCTGLFKDNGTLTKPYRSLNNKAPRGQLGNITIISGSYCFYGTSVQSSAFTSC